MEVKQDDPESEDLEESLKSPTTLQLDKEESNLPLWLLEYGSKEVPQNNSSPSPRLITSPSSSPKQLDSSRSVDLLHQIQSLAESESSAVCSSILTNTACSNINVESPLKSSSLSQNDVCQTKFDDYSKEQTLSPAPAPENCIIDKAKSTKKDGFDSDSTPENWYDNLSSEEDNVTSSDLKLVAQDDKKKLISIQYTALKNCTSQKTDIDSCIASDDCSLVESNTDSPTACETKLEDQCQETISNSCITNAVLSPSDCESKPTAKKSNSLLKLVAMQKVIGKKFVRKPLKKVSIDELVHLIEEIKPDSETGSNHHKSRLDSVETLIHKTCQPREIKSTNQLIRSKANPQPVKKLSQSASDNFSDSPKCDIKPLKLRIRRNTENSSDVSCSGLNDSGVDVDVAFTPPRQVNNTVDLSLNPYLMQFRQQANHMNTAGIPEHINGTPMHTTKSSSSVGYIPTELGCQQFIPRVVNAHERNMTLSDNVRDRIQQLYHQSAQRQPWPTSLMNEFAFPGFHDAQAASSFVNLPCTVAKNPTMLDPQCGELSQEKLNDILKKIQLSDSYKTNVGRRPFQKAETVKDSDLAFSQSDAIVYSKQAAKKTIENASASGRLSSVHKFVDFSGDRISTSACHFASKDNSLSSAMNGVLGPCHHNITSKDHVIGTNTTSQYSTANVEEQLVSYFSSMNTKPFVMTSLKYFTKKPAPK
ncbi:uncharacterized protein LOC106055452 [Biomphalaria glabrata]|uniref:Uncharacterized protein LOC106055452 n=1 Tax=Biomphalaria glabrata TaxID=6526 RepID=A0A2C9LZH8_BIOGL|nr:uncharacterized protein LOC106055452 [Biomphalaria glabrata]